MALALLVRVAIVDGAVGFCGVVSQHLHDINFAAAGPLTIPFFLGGHHPESRQKPPACRHLDPCLKNAVQEIVLVLGVDPPGDIRHRPVWIFLFHRFQHQAAVLDVDGLGGIYVGL